MSQHIRVWQNFISLPDAPLIGAAGAVINGQLKSDPTVDVKEVQKPLDEFIAAIGAQMNGGPGATAEKNNKRADLIAVLRKMAHHVQDSCGGDPAKVLNSGFAVVSSSNRALVLSDKAKISSADSGKTGELVIKAETISGALCYEAQVAEIGTDGVPGPWQRAGTFRKRSARAMTLRGLKPKTDYAIQIRAFGGSDEHTDWSEPVTRTCW